MDVSTYFPPLFFRGLLEISLQEPSTRLSAHPLFSPDPYFTPEDLQEPSTQRSLRSPAATLTSYFSLPSILEQQTYKNHHLSSLAPPRFIYFFLP